MPTPQVHGFYDPETSTISYVVIDPATKRAAIIDSVLDYDPASGHTKRQAADKLIACVKANDATVDWLLETHIHADHLSAAPYLKSHLGGRLGIGSHVAEVQGGFARLYNIDHPADGSPFEHLFKDGEIFSVGNIPARAIHTPGHTPACMSYLIGDALFVGDTIFMPDYGSARCDFPGGDARQLYRSVHKIFALPEETRMFLCHDYLPEGRKEIVWETSVGVQKHQNIHMRAGITEDDFVAMREARDRKLSAPRLILPAVQVNIRGGNLPEPESNGVRYLKIPMDKF